MSTSSFIAEYHISFYIGGRVFSHKVTGTIGGAYIHMDVLIERAEHEVNTDRARRGLAPLSADNRKVRTIEHIDPEVRAHMAQARAHGQTGYRIPR